MRRLRDRPAMKWMWVVVVACGSNDAPTPPSTNGVTMEATMAATMEATMTAPTMDTESANSTRRAPTPTEPTEVPEELRESHDRLVARIEANSNDVPSICALASVLRRAEMLTAAQALLDDAFRLVGDSLLDLQLPEGTREACLYERGRIDEARGDLSSAHAAYWEAMATPIERRRRIVLDAFLRVAHTEVRESCDSMSKVGLRGLLTLKDDPVFRRCLRVRERDEPTCDILRLDDPQHPGTRVDDFDEHTTIGNDGAAFGIIGNELYVISVIRGRKQVRLCDFDLPDDSRLSFPRVFTLGDQALFSVSTMSMISYSCECAEGEEGPELSPDDCRCEDAFDIRYLFTDRGELRLALIDDYSTTDGMPGVTWDQPYLRESISGGPSVDGDVLRIGRRLRLRGHVLVPAE